ncbi:MAG TPA: TIGR03617 family F420-dependent LLM class oxidoreductase, partial [Acidimicrobiales bacterium]|nr:TIGR03617 family F420-dependent LLM class oxidoreductase [Acidimicrobiales bacterium]
HARRVESIGYDGLHVAETVHDALAMALLAVEHTERLTVRTSVALAFTRSPVLTAYAAWDLSKFGAGRFELGLGTQIRQNIEDRYAMPFSADPIGQLRDYVGAVRSAFEAFRSGQAPSFESEHYRVTRMQPYFNPGPDEATAVPRIYLGGVQRKACALAGAIADGFVTHPTNSNPRYLDTVCRPGLAEGAAGIGRDLAADGFELVVGTQVITGATAAALDAERERQRRLLAFLYSTPAYRPTLELYGWAELGPQLRALIHRDEWDALGQLLSDEVIDTLVPTGTFDDLPKLLHDRFAGLAQGIVVSPPPDTGHDAAFAEVIRALQAS